LTTGHKIYQIAPQFDGKKLNDDNNDDDEKRL